MKLRDITWRVREGGIYAEVSPYLIHPERRRVRCWRFTDAAPHPGLYIYSLCTDPRALAYGGHGQWDHQREITALEIQALLVGHTLDPCQREHMDDVTPYFPLPTR
jgi:hypothetical protein